MSTWTKQKLDQMIADKVEESLALDYKRAASLDKAGDKKKAEITKPVAPLSLVPYLELSFVRHLYHDVQKGTA
jgi:hypothetical protein